jgi:TPR repeat protein
MTLRPRKWIKYFLANLLCALLSAALLPPCQGDDTELDTERMKAESGDAEAQFALGNRYIRGDGVPENFAEALQWLRLSADQGNTGAMNNLGIMHSRGMGVAQDYAEAAKWYQLAANQGDAAAMNNLAHMYKNG